MELGLLNFTSDNASFDLGPCLMWHIRYGLESPRPIPRLSVPRDVKGLHMRGTRVGRGGGKRYPGAGPFPGKEIRYPISKSGL
jgi:hypothetical protein